MVILVKDINKYCYTNKDGDVLRELVAPAIGNSVAITVDFKHITSVSSSFVNSFLGELIEEFGYYKVKSYLTLKNVNKTVGNVFRNRLMDEVAC